jgi:beta propeller repeat protein
MKPDFFSASAILAELLSSFGNAVICQPRPKIECGCDSYGDYVSPSVKAILVEESEIIKEGYSSDEDPEYMVFQESAAPPDIVTLSIYRGNRMIFSQTNTALGWGFSPDQDRFLMHGFTADRRFWWSLVDLDPDPSQQGEAVVVHDPVITSLKTSSANLAFSPHGKYIVTASVLELEGRLLLDVYRTKDLHKVFSYSTNAIVGPAVRKGSAGWGFSPDARDASFVFSFLVDVNMYALYAVNLTKEEDPYIMEAHPVDNTMGFATFSFSKCGDYFAWRYEEPSSAPQCRLYRTDSKNVFKQASAAGFVRLYSASEGHYIEYLGVPPLNVVDNTADEPCPDTEKPTWSEEAFIDTGMVQGVKLQVEWGGDSDGDYDVTAYLITVTDQEDNPVGEYLYDYFDKEQPEKKFTVTGLEPETDYKFRIEAGDDAGNWSTDGPSATFSTFPDSPPYWPTQTLRPKNVTETKATLFWDEPAADDYGILFYEIITSEEDTLTCVGGGESEASVLGLTPGKTYTFRIEAGDEAGFRAKGAALTLEGRPLKEPEWPVNASLTCSDSTETSLTVNWPPATDESTEMRGYIIFRENDSLTTVDRYTLSHRVKDLDEGSAYTFSVIAFDESDNRSVPLSGLLSTIPSYTADTLVSGPGNQKRPDIDGNLVAWWDDRNDEGDIYMIDIDKDETTRVTDNPSLQFSPAVSNGLIVWSDRRNGDLDIYMRDASGTEVAVLCCPG